MSAPSKLRAFTFKVDGNETKTCQIIAVSHDEAQEKAHDLLARVAKAQGREEQRHKLQLVSFRKAQPEEIEIGNVVNSASQRMVKVDLSTIPVPLAMAIRWRKGEVRLMGEERSISLKGEELLEQLVNADEQDLNVSVLSLDTEAKARVESYMKFAYMEQLAVKACIAKGKWPRD